MSCVLNVKLLIIRISTRQYFYLIRRITYSSLLATSPIDRVKSCSMVVLKCYAREYTCLTERLSSIKVNRCIREFEDSLNRSMALNRGNLLNALRSFRFISIDFASIISEILRQVAVLAFRVLFRGPEDERHIRYIQVHRLMCDTDLVYLQ